MKPTMTQLSFSYVIALGLVSVAAVTIAAAPKLPPAAFKVAPPGTTIVWKNLNSGEVATTVVQAADGYTVKRMVDGKEYSRYGFFAKWPRTISEEQRRKFDQIWPLETGKSVSYERSANDKRWHDEVTVVRTETVTVGAGTFDAYVVEWESRGLSHSWSGRCLRWYSPELGWNVKTECADSATGPQRWEMVRLSPPQ